METDPEIPESIQNEAGDGKHHRADSLSPAELNSRLANATEQLAKVVALQAVETDKDVLKKLASRREYWELAQRSYLPSVFKKG